MKLYQKEYPKIQILTVEGLLNGTERLEVAPQANPFAEAEREVKAGTHPRFKAAVDALAEAIKEAGLT
jgi:hypothetical protein